MKIIMIVAISADGKVAKNTTQKSTDWTSNADKKLFIKTTKNSGVVIMGRTTYQTIGIPLKNRLNIILTSTPNNYSNIENLLEFHNKTPIQIKTYLENKGFDTAVLCGGTKTYTDFIKANCVDEIYLTIEPKLFGNGIPLFNKIDLNINLNLQSIQKIGDNSIFIKWKVL